MTGSILVPLDGSTFGEHSLPLAMAMARRLDAPLNLIHVHSLLDATFAELEGLDAATGQKMRTREEGYLSAIQKQVQDRLSVPVTIHCIGGDEPGGEVAGVVCEQADRLSAAWVVITTHARGPMGRLWFGSTTDELIRSLPIPLIAIHAGKEADLTADQPVRHMLVPLDGTPLVEDILHSAVPFAKAMAADVTLLRVVTSSALQDGASAYLAAVADRLRKDGLTVHTQVSVAKDAGLAILNAAKPPIDLIAIEMHGRSGVSRLLLGNVVDEVVRGTHLPILVQRPKA